MIFCRSVGRAFSGAFQRGLPGGSPPVLCCCNSVFLAPDGDQVAIKHVLDMTWVENVKRYLSRASAKFHGASPCALQTPVFEPPMPLGRRDGQNVLDLTRYHWQVFDGFQNFAYNFRCLPK